MATIARIIVTENDLQNKNKLFSDFISESKKILSKGEKHQFVLLPAGFLTFSINADLANTPLAEPEDDAKLAGANERYGYEGYGFQTVRVEEKGVVLDVIQPPLPATMHLVEERSERPAVARNAVVAVMTSHLFAELLPLLSNRLVPILPTPLVHFLDTTDNPRFHCFAFYHPAALPSFTPVVRKTEQIERFRLSASERSHAFSDLLCSPGVFRDFAKKPQDLPSSRESSIVRSLLFQRPRPDRPSLTIARRSMLLPLS